MKYATIVADPPWRTSAGPARFEARKPTLANLSTVDPRYTPQTRPLAYPALSVPEIAALRVPAAKDAHLYLWTINAYVEDAYAVARAWGFTPSTLLVWCKRPRGIGLGGTFSIATEYVLFCRRGSLAASQRLDTNWWLWKRTARHSQKPDAFFAVVESVSPGPYLELFARRPREGWHVWGDEVDSDIELVA